MAIQVTQANKLAWLRRKQLLAMMCALHKEQQNKYADSDTQSQESVKNRYKAFLASPDTQFHIYTQHDVPHAMLMAQSIPYSKQEQNNTRYLSSFYTEPKYRSKGIGAALLDNVQEQSRDAKIKKLLLGVYTKNPAVSLYKRKGYEPYAYQMQKDLTKKAALTTKQLKQLAAPYYTPERKVHIREVLNFARQLKQKRLNSIQLAAIYLHDAAKKEQSKGHQARGAQLSRQLLTGKYTPEQVQQIANAIKQHSADLRLATKDFKHSSPTAELLALADDANITTRDPMWMAMMTARFAHRNPDIYSNDKDKAFKRHISFWSPTESHKNLQWYGKPWSQMTKDVSDKIYNFPQQTWNKLWNTVTADTEIPDAKTWNKIHNYRGV